MHLRPGGSFIEVLIRDVGDVDFDLLIDIGGGEAFVGRHVERWEKEDKKSELLGVISSEEAQYLTDFCTQNIAEK